MFRQRKEGGNGDSYHIHPGIKRKQLGSSSGRHGEMIQRLGQGQSPYAECVAAGAKNVTVKTEVIESWSGVESLAEEWNKLLRESRADTIFLTWEWVRTWISVAGRSLKPFVITVRSMDGELLGLAPFYVTKYRLLKLIPCRILRVMADYPTGAEYPDWIVHRDHEVETTREIAMSLRLYGKQWDSIWMPNVAVWTGATERILQACREAGLLCRERPASFSGFELPKNMNGYLEALSSNMRSVVRRQVKKISGREGVVIDRCLTTESLPDYLQALFDLHYRRWRLKGEEGAFRRKPKERQFYEQFAPAALRAGWLRLYALKERGEIKAVQIGYVYNNIFHLLQEGFDPDYADGVGNVLRLHVIEACIAEGIASYDFLGVMSEHKRRWQANERLGSDVMIGRPSWMSRAIIRNGIWPTGRFLCRVGTL